MSPSEESQQALIELIEKGVSASADALASVSHTQWMTQTTSVNTDGIEAVQKRVADDAKPYYGAYCTTDGAVFLLMVPKQSGPALAQAFLSGRKSRPGSVPPREEVCVAEISNIVINAVSNTLADACDDAFFLSAPEMVLDKKAVLLKVALDKLKTAGESFAIMTYVHMSSEELSSDCTVVLLLTPACRGRLLRALDQ